MRSSTRRACCASTRCSSTCPAVLKRRANRLGRDLVKHHAENFLAEILRHIHCHWLLNFRAIFRSFCIFPAVAGFLSAPQRFTGVRLVIRIHNSSSLDVVEDFVQVRANGLAFAVRVGRQIHRVGRGAAFRRSFTTLSLPGITT